MNERPTSPERPAPPPGLSYRGVVLAIAVSLGAWGASTLSADWLAPRVTDAVSAVEGLLGVELAPQENDR